MKRWLLRWLIRDFYASDDWPDVTKEIWDAHRLRYTEENEPTSLAAITEDLANNSDHCKNWSACPVYQR